MRLARKEKKPPAKPQAMPGMAGSVQAAMRAAQGGIATASGSGSTTGSHKAKAAANSANTSTRRLVIDSFLGGIGRGIVGLGFRSSLRRRVGCRWSVGGQFAFDADRIFGLALGVGELGEIEQQLGTRRVDGVAGARV